jgi:hypothetical protein
MSDTFPAADLEIRYTPRRPNPAIPPLVTHITASGWRISRRKSGFTVVYPISR